MKFDLSKEALDKLGTSFSARALRSQIAILKATYYIKEGRTDEAIAEILAEAKRMDDEKEQAKRH